MLRSRLAAALLLVAIAPVPASATVILAVDIGRDGQAVEPGFTGYSTVGGPNDIDLFVPQAFDGGSWDLEGVVIGVTTRNYGDIPTSPLGDLLEDSVLMNASPQDSYIELVLDGLTPGDYELTTYHHSHSIGGARAELLGGLAGEEPVSFGLLTSTTGTDIASFASFTVGFTTTAAQDGYALRFAPDNARGSFHFDLSGFELDAISVPEPAMSMLLALGGLAALGVGRSSSRTW